MSGGKTPAAGFLACSVDKKRQPFFVTNFTTIRLSYFFKRRRRRKGGVHRSARAHARPALPSTGHPTRLECRDRFRPSAIARRLVFPAACRSLMVGTRSILGAVLQRSLSRPAHRFGDRPATVAAESANQPVDTTGGGVQLCSRQCSGEKLPRPVRRHFLHKDAG